MRPFLVGNRVALAPLHHDDLKTIADWTHDPRVTQYMYLGLVPSYPQVLELAFEEMLATLPDNLIQNWPNPRHIVLAIINVPDSEFIGVTGLFEINWMQRMAELRAYIGSADHLGGGRIDEAYRLLLAYAFDRLNLRRITAGCRVDNLPALIALRKVGFQVEGRFREHMEQDGTFYDILPLGLLREDFFAQVRGS